MSSKTKRDGVWFIRHCFHWPLLNCFLYPPNDTDTHDRLRDPVSARLTENNCAGCAFSPVRRCSTWWARWDGPLDLWQEMDSGTGPMTVHLRCRHRRTHPHSQYHTNTQQKCWVTICECWISWLVLSWQAVQTKCPICSLMAWAKWMRSTVESFSFSFFFTLFRLSLLIQLRLLLRFALSGLFLFLWTAAHPCLLIKDLATVYPPLPYLYVFLSPSAHTFVLQLRTPSLQMLGNQFYLEQTPPGTDTGRETEPQFKWHVSTDGRSEVRGKSTVCCPAADFSGRLVSDWVKLARRQPNQRAGVLFLWTEC